MRRIPDDRAGHAALVIVELSLADGATWDSGRGSSRDVPVLYLSRDAHGLTNTAPPRRFGAVLTMPFDSGDLLDCVDRLLGRCPEPPPDAPRPAA